MARQLIRIKEKKDPDVKSTPGAPCQLLYGTDCKNPHAPLNSKVCPTRPYCGRKISDHSRDVSMRLECLPGLQQRLQPGQNTWPSIGAASVSAVILGPLVMRHRYFGGFGLLRQFNRCA